MKEVSPMDLIRLYDQITNEIASVEIGSARCEKYKHLVTFKDNKTEPVHRWFTFKEGFSHKLLANVVDDFLLKQPRKLLDPFCGSGTSLLSWQTHQGLADGLSIGLERNPFIEFVAKTKLAWQEFDPQTFWELAQGVLHEGPVASSTDPNNKPNLTTLHNPRVFEPSIVDELIGYRERIISLASGSREVDLLLLGWSSVIERVSSVRKDGRALRVVNKPNRPNVHEALKDTWSCMHQDILNYRLKHNTTRAAAILPGDARFIRQSMALYDLEVSSEGFDLILYSPPYLNNFDYTEVYKMELWMNGLVKSYDEFREQRLKTFRSHPSISFPSTQHLLESDSVWGTRIWNELSAASKILGKGAKRTRELFLGYLDDMYLSLREQYELCSKGGNSICIVANSLHGPKHNAIPVATDLIIAALAMDVGFEVTDLLVCRNITRRVNPEHDLYRESLIVMRK